MLFLETHALVRKTHSCGHRLMEDVFESGTNLPRTVSRSPGNVELCAVVLVESQNELRPGDLFHMHERAERHLATVRAPNVELINVLNVRARVPFCFHKGLPLPAETVEIIDQITAHEGLHGRVNRAEIHLLLNSLFAVDLRVELRNSRQVRWKSRGDFRALQYSPEQSVYIFGEEGGIVVDGAILEDHGYTPRGSDAENSGRRKREGEPFAYACQLLLHGLLNGLNLLLARFAHIPRLQRDKEEGRICTLRLGEQVIAIGANDALNALSLQQRFCDALCGGVGTLQGGCIRQLQGNEEVTIVFLGKEATGEAPADQES